MQPFDFKNYRKQALYLNLVVLRGLDVKTLMYCFPPKLAQQVLPEVSSPAL